MIRLAKLDTLDKPIELKSANLAIEITEAAAKTDNPVRTVIVDDADDNGSDFLKHFVGQGLMFNVKLVHVDIKDEADIIDLIAQIYRYQFLTLMIHQNGWDKTPLTARDAALIMALKNGYANVSPELQLMPSLYNDVALFLSDWSGDDYITYVNEPQIIKHVVAETVMHVCAASDGVNDLMAKYWEAKSTWDDTQSWCIALRAMPCRGENGYMHGFTPYNSQPYVPFGYRTPLPIDD